MKSSTECCGLCTKGIEKETGLAVFQYMTSQGNIRRGNKFHTICNVCIKALTKEVITTDNIEKIREMVKSSWKIENNLFEIVDESIIEGNLLSFKNLKERKEDSSVFVDRNPRMSRYQEGSKTIVKKKTQVYSPNGEHYSENPSKTIADSYLTPREVFSKLREIVIGQDEAMKTVSVEVFKHLHLLRNPHGKKSNLLMIGPTGVGKTETVTAIEDILGTPMMRVNCGTLTPAGYKGDNVNSIVEKAISTFGDRAKTMILYLDEVDKLVSKGDKDELRALVQQDLLKILDGDTIMTSSHRGESLSLSFKRVLIIASGAFPALERSMEPKKVLGFGENGNIVKEINPMKKITNDHLFNYGFIPEFVGRFSTITVMNNLTDEDMLRVLRDSKKSSLNDYTQLFEEFKCKVVFHDSFLLETIKEACKKKTGARGIKSVLDSKIESILFEIQAYENGTLHLKSEEEGGFHFESNIDMGEIAC